MSNRADELLTEMQQVFGPSFGTGEDDPFDEGWAGDKLKAAGKAAGRGLRRAVKRVFGRKKKKEKESKRDTTSKRGTKKADHSKSKKFEKDVDKAKAKVSRKPDLKVVKKDDGDAKGPSSLGGGGSRQEKPQQVLGKKSARRHFPFKRSANLGPGPRNRHHDETKCWNCKCGNVYREGCRCAASGKGENCPPKGTIKKISFKPGYKRAYNREYHMWRAKQGGRVTQRLGATRTAL